MSSPLPLAEIIDKASGFSVIDRVRLELIARCADRQAQKPSADFIELGVFRGGSALLLASVIKHHNIPHTLHLLDSWCGLPEIAEEDQGVIAKQGTFAQSSEDAVRARLDTFKLLDVCKTYRGWVENTLPELHGPFSLAHLDLDLYKPTHFALSTLLPRMTDDGEIIIDDYGKESLRRFPGVEKAVSELLIGSDWHIAETAGERDQSVRLIRQP